MVFNGCKVFHKLLSFYLQSPLLPSLAGGKRVKGSPQWLPPPWSWHWSQGHCQHIQMPQHPVPGSQCLDTPKQAKLWTRKPPRLSWSIPVMRAYENHLGSFENHQCSDPTSRGSVWVGPENWGFLQAPHDFNRQSALRYMSPSTDCFHASIPSAPTKFP